MSDKVPKYDGPYAVEFDKAYDSIDAIVKAFKESIEDGFQLRDITTWTPLIIKAYDSAKEIFGEEVSKDKVVAMAQYIYWAVDPNIPFLPDFIEDKIEKWAIIDIAIPLAVNAAWDAVQSYIAKKQ